MLSVRGGGSRAATWIATMALVVSFAAAIAAAAARAVLPWTTLVAAAPGLLAAAVPAVTAPSPAKLRSVGWTLIGISAATALILIAGLRT